MPLSSRHRERILGATPRSLKRGCIRRPVSTWDIGLEQLTILVTYPVKSVASTREPSLLIRLIKTERILLRTPRRSSLPPIPTAKVIIATYCSMLAIPPLFKMDFSTAMSVSLVNPS